MAWGGWNNTINVDQVTAEVRRWQSGDGSPERVVVVALGLVDGDERRARKLMEWALFHYIKRTPGRWYAPDPLPCLEAS